MRTISVMSIVAASFGALVALTTYTILCFGESGGSTMCPSGNPTATMTAQLVVGLLGLLPPLAMAYFAYHDENSKARSAFFFGLVVWAGWAFLNDAAVHQWGSQMKLIP